MKAYSNSQQIVLTAIILLILCTGNSKMSPSSLSSFCDPKPFPHEHGVIEVLGLVPSPGIYLFDGSPTVGQAIRKAGGQKIHPGIRRRGEFTPLQSGTTVHVTSRNSGSHFLTSTDIAKSFVAGLPMDINQASANELSLVPGISATLAQRMVTFRNARGMFRSWQDLNRVKGVGPATMARLENSLHIGKLP